MQDPRNLVWIKSHFIEVHLRFLQNGSCIFRQMHIIQLNPRLFFWESDGILRGITMKWLIIHDKVRNPRSYIGMYKL